MKFVSWNVNGLRACVNKGFLDSFYALDADFFCVQETKLQEGQITLDLPGYQQFWCCAEKKGYSGTAIFTKHTPITVTYGLGIEELDTEGRLITLEYPEFYLVTCYTPNAQRGLARIEHRLKWEEAFRNYLRELDAKKPVILCGDLNVAHKEIDLKNPASNRGNAGFSDEERDAFSKLLSSGFTDSFRHLYPDVAGAYSWWSYMFNARANNAGWRIDYFVVSDRLADSIHDATIHPDIMGSDHCPVGLDLNITCNGAVFSPKAERPETEEKKETDGDAPVGPFPMVVFSILITALLLIPAWLLFNPTPEPEGTPPTTQLTETATSYYYADLIDEVIDRSRTAVWRSSPHNIPLDPLSSTTPPTTITTRIIDGEEQWALKNVTSIFPSENDGSTIIGADYFNYFVQISFTNKAAYDLSNMPELFVSISSGDDPTTNSSHVLAYYENEQGNIEGCFIYGYTQSFPELHITAVYRNMKEIVDVPTVVPAGTLDHLSTKELVDTIQSSGIILSMLTSGQYDHTDPVALLVHKSPYIRELLHREDAIRILLDRIRDWSNIPTGDVAMLLHQDSFQNIMTDEENEEWGQWMCTHILYD